MKRLHVLLRLFVLAAMALSFAEAVWVSTCLPMESMAPMEGLAMSDAPANDAMPGMRDMPMPDMPVPGDRQQGEQDVPCPLGAAAVAQGCATASSLPAMSAEPFTATAERVMRVSVVQVPHDMIDGATPFHPPRA